MAYYHCKNCGLGMLASAKDYLKHIDWCKKK